jgi:predicted phage terminase large subunit-like protein
MDTNGDVYYRDMIRVQGWIEFKERCKSAMLSDLEKGTTWGVEDVAFQALAFQELMRDRELANVNILRIAPEGDKVTRARPLQGRGKAGKVKLVRGPWIQIFILEALDFPNGQHDDQIDTASGGLQMIASPIVIDGEVVY